MEEAIGSDVSRDGRPRLEREGTDWVIRDSSGEITKTLTGPVNHISYEDDRWVVKDDDGTVLDSDVDLVAMMTRRDSMNLTSEVLELLRRLESGKGVSCNLPKRDQSPS